MSDKFQVWAVYWIIVLSVYVPFRYIPWPAGFSAFKYVPTVAIVCLAIAWLLARRGTLGDFFRSDPLALPIGYIHLSLAVTSVGAFDSATSFGKTVFYFLGGPVVYVILRAAVVPTEAVRRLVRGTVLWACVLGLYGVLEYVLQANFWLSSAFQFDSVAYSRLLGTAFVRFDVPFEYRIVGTLGHPVLLSLIYATISPLALYLALCGTGRGERLAGLAAYASLVAGLYLTFSRGGWAAFLVANGLFLWFFRRKLLWWTLPCLLIVVALTGVSERLSASWQSRGTVETLQNPADDPRGLAYKYAGAIFERHLLWGVGVGNYAYFARPLGSRLKTPDNMYMTWLAESGLMGFGLWTWLLFLSARSARGAWVAMAAGGADGGRDRPLLLALCCALAAFAVDMLTCDALYFPSTRLLFWFLLGLVVVVSVARKPAEEGVLRP